MSNGPVKPRVLQPFKKVDVEAEDRDSHVQRLTGTEESPFELTSPFQRTMLLGLEEVRRGLQGVQEGQQSLEGAQAKLFVGQTDLTTAFGAVKAEVAALVPRVKKLETAAQWRVWAMRALKAGVPVAAAIIGRYSPELAKHIPDILKWLEPFLANPPV
jgi:hypothetical protein